MGATADGLRVAVTTLTIAPVRAPRTVDRRRAGIAMGNAPLVGLLIGVIAALAVFGTRELLGVGQQAKLTTVPEPTFVPAVIGVAITAMLTRGLHLDGLADTVDGLGSMKPAAQAREVMRRGDVGPLGATAIVLVLLVQVGALAEAIGDHHGTAAMLVACMASRCALPVACRAGVPAADTSGLGALVAGTVARWWAAFLVGGCIATAALIAALDVHTLDRHFEIGQAVTAVVAALGVAELLRRHCSRRLGGVTGDVLGALVEVGMTVALLVMAVVPPLEL